MHTKIAQRLLKTACSHSKQYMCHSSSSFLSLSLALLLLRNEHIQFWSLLLIFTQLMCTIHLLLFMQCYSTIRNFLFILRGKNIWCLSEVYTYGTVRKDLNVQSHCNSGKADSFVHDSAKQKAIDALQRKYLNLQLHVQEKPTQHELCLFEE